MDTSISRRKALQLSSAALLSAGLWPGALKAANFRSDGRFRFLAINDLHFMSPECGNWLYFVCAQMRRHPHVDFALVSGDLTEQGDPKHMAGVKSVLKELDCPAYVQIGNHDYTKEGSRAAYEKIFPKRLNYSFNHEGWQFVSLDTTEGTKYEKTKIQPETFQWVRNNYARWNKTKPMIIFTHFPLAEGVRYRPENANELLDLFRDFNLKATFSGHYHALTHKQKESTNMWTGRCCALKRNNHDGSKEKGYLLVDVADGQVSAKFYEVV